ncbi:MAG: sulfate transporter [Chloroflexi bacterium]|nr:sulfate transporter [Chloroflexota bacterium]
MELAGAFGDIGTLLPFVVGYVTIAKMDPTPILLAFGISKIFGGFYYKTPMPVQPMKAIGGAAIAQYPIFTPSMIWGSTLFMALFWPLMGLTGALDLISKMTTKPIVRGIMLGLGLKLLLDGVVMMSQGPLVAIPGMVLTFLLLTSKKLPAILVLLAYGVAVSLFQDPALGLELRQISLGLRLPELAITRMTLPDLMAGSILLGLAQIPLTLGNAIIATTAENNELFPHRPVTLKRLSITTGLINGVSAIIGGVPMCHGAGGMAGHVRFGARTGGSLVLLGVIVLIIALFFGPSVEAMFRLFPEPVLGVILLFTGAELASVIKDIKGHYGNIYVLVITTGLAMWHMGYAFLAGLILYYAIQRRIIKIGDEKSY